MYSIKSCTSNYHLNLINIQTQQTFVLINARKYYSAQIKYIHITQMVVLGMYNVGMAQKNGHTIDALCYCSDMFTSTYFSFLCAFIKTRLVEDQE